MPSLADVIGGKVSERASDKQTSWFLNLGVRGNSPQSARLFTTKQRKRAWQRNPRRMVYPIDLGLTAHYGAARGHQSQESSLWLGKFSMEVTLVSAYSMKTVECKGS